MVGASGTPDNVGIYAMYPYRRLAVWQRAHALAVATYRTGVLNESERFRSLVNQLRRSAVSIAANIAEGAGSASQPMLARYLGIALASAYELECHLLLARDVECLSSERGQELLPNAEKLIRMLTALLRTVRRRGKR